MHVSEERKTRDAERSRRVILDAAERLFANRGYRGTSLQEVGEAAGVSRGTPSYFFGSKVGLYRAVLHRNLSQVGSVLRGIRERSEAGGAESTELITRLIEGYIDFLVAHPTYVRLVQWEAVHGGEMLDEFAPRLALIQEMEGVIQEAVDRGAFRPVDTRQLMLSIIALCWFPVAEKDALLRAMDINPLDADFAQTRKRHVVELILDGIRVDPAS